MRGPDEARVEQVEANLLGSFLASVEVALGSILVSASATDSRGPEDARGALRVSLGAFRGGVRREAIDVLEIEELLGGVTVLLLAEGSSPR
mmetsp:Transcript_21274/g.33088  ORF Transcript_21274/g.33088 Transcript_21274/m.33088 type:complete len:91 (+) Transcript_21274:473-745(+)